MKQYQEIVFDFYKKQTPIAVIKCHKSNPDWFYTKCEVRLNGNGFDYVYVKTPSPVICNSGNVANLVLTNEISHSIQLKKREYEEADKKYKQLKDETYNALINLRTYAQIESNFPEAAKLLPKVTLALIINVDTTRSKINSKELV